MVRPSRDEFRALASARRPVPLIREILADLDTPLATFLKLDDEQTAFLFESVEGEEQWGRYSIIGVGARARFEAGDERVEITRGDAVETRELAPGEDPLHHLRALIEELRPAELPDPPQFSGGAVGFLSYDWVRHVEHLPTRKPDPIGLPDCSFTFPDVVLVHDRMRQRIAITVLVDVAEVEGSVVDAAYDRGLARLDAVIERLAEPLPRSADMLRQGNAGVPDLEPASLEAASNMTRETYHDSVKRSREYIQAGDVFQVVQSQRFTLPRRADPIAIYRWLRVINPSPYLFLLRAGPDRVVVGSSPEILVRLEKGEVRLRPIAGTRPRGATPEEDLENERSLLADPKELAEHIMLVDLGRNDVGRVAEIGSVHVDELQVVERYSHVMHIVSNVRGDLRADCDAIDVLRASFPAGTLSGAPKVRAMEIIDELEPERRGLYGGSVGYIEYNGDMDMCIAIRTMLIQRDAIYVQAGAGIVADSDPQREYEETLQKAGALLRAIALAERDTPS